MRARPRQNETIDGDDLAPSSPTIVTTASHGFWLADKDSATARDLKPGEALRKLGGLVKIIEIHRGQVQDVFNFEVESDRTFGEALRSTQRHFRVF